MVVPGADVRLRWALQAPAEEVILAVDDEVLGRWAGADDPSFFEDRCTAERCTTESPRQVTYTLTAIFSRVDGQLDSRSAALTISPNGLQVLTFRVSPSVLAAGEEAVLSWTTAGAVRGRIEAAPAEAGTAQLIVELDAETIAAGHLPVEVTAPTAFTLAATGPDGRETRASAATTSLGTAHFSSLEATPPAVHPGQTATIRWRATGMERVSILRDDGGTPLLGIGGTEANDGAREVAIHGPVRFHLVGTSLEGAPVEELCDDEGCRPSVIDVGVLPRARVLHFEAVPASIPIGGASLLTFEAEGADALRLLWEEDGRPREELLLPEATSFEVTPRASTRYTLSAMSQGEVESTAFASVQVRPVATLEVGLDPSTGGVWAGELATVSWTSRGAGRLQLDVGHQLVDLTGHDPSAGQVEVRIPDLADGDWLPIVLTAFGTHALDTVTVEVQVWRR